MRPPSLVCAIVDGKQYEVEPSILVEVCRNYVLYGLRGRQLVC